MVARLRYLTPAYKFEEMAEQWCTGPLLGIAPSLLNDDRIGRVLSALGANTETMEEVLFKLVMEAGKKAGIPLNKFMLDTTVLKLDGKFKDAGKGTKPCSCRFCAALSKLHYGFLTFQGTAGRPGQGQGARGLLPAPSLPLSLCSPTRNC